MTVNTVVSLIGALSALLAAAFWLWASLITVPDNIDTFITILQRIGRLNAYAAFCAFVAAACGAYLFGSQLWSRLPYHV